MEQIKSSHTYGYKYAISAHWKGTNKKVFEKKKKIGTNKNGENNKNWIINESVLRVLCQKVIALKTDLKGKKMENVSYEKEFKQQKNRRTMTNTKGLFVRFFFSFIDQVRHCLQRINKKGMYKKEWIFHYNRNGQKNE